MITVIQEPGLRFQKWLGQKSGNWTERQSYRFVQSTSTSLSPNHISSNARFCRGPYLWMFGWNHLSHRLPFHQSPSIRGSRFIVISFSGEISVHGMINALPGATFGVGPNTLQILCHQVELDIIWVNRDHGSIRLPDDFTMHGIEFVGDLQKCSSWLFPWSRISFDFNDRLFIFSRFKTATLSGFTNR